MDNYRWINKGHQRVEVDIARVQKRYRAEYVADLCIRDQNGRWAPGPHAVFWQENPPVEGYSNYFAIGISREAGHYITSGWSVADGVWQGAEAVSGEIIFSRFWNDHRMSADQTASVKWGRERHDNNKGIPVLLRVVGPDFSIVDG